MPIAEEETPAVVTIQQQQAEQMRMHWKVRWAALVQIFGRLIYHPVYPRNAYQYWANALGSDSEHA